MTNVNFPYRGGGSTAGFLTLSPSNAALQKMSDAVPSPKVSEPMEIDLLEYWRMLSKRRWTVISCVLVMLGLALLVTLLSTPIYKGMSTVQVEQEAARIVQTHDGDHEIPRGDEVSFYATQLQLLTSRSLAERVVRSLGIANDASFLAASSPSPMSRLMTAVRGAGATPSPFARMSPGAREAKAVKVVQKGLHVEVLRGSHVFKISFASPSPAFAARVANAFADQFIQSNLDRRFEASAYARNFLENKLQDIRNKLEDSERSLVQYAQSQQIINLENGNPLGNSTLATQDEALAAAKNEKIKAETLWLQALHSSGEDLPQVLADPSIQLLQSKRAGLLADYQQGLQTYTAQYPQMVAAKAQIDETTRQIATAINSVKNSLKTQYDASESQERALEGQFNKEKSNSLDMRARSIRYDTLQREVDTNRQLYDGLLQNFKEVGVAGGVGANNISVVDRALAPHLPYLRSWLLNGGVALVLGLLSGGALALLLEHIDETLKVPQEIEDRLGLTMLGSSPELEKGMSPEVALMDHRSPFSESYYSIRTSLQFLSHPGALRSLLITSTRPSEGKSTTAFTLATDFAQIGMRVLLIDADLRNPTLDRTFKDAPVKGLATFLSGGVSLSEIVQPTKIPSLFFMSSGPLQSNPTELLASVRLRQLLSEAEAAYDLVVIDGPPVMGLADAALLAHVASGTVIIIEAGQTRIGYIKTAIKRLRLSQANIIGAVMTKFNPKNSGYGYGYGYGYGAGYGEDDYRYGGKLPKPKFVNERV